MSASTNIFPSVQEVAQAILNNNMAGKGSNGSVLHLKKHPQYVLKIPHGVSIDKSNAPNVCPPTPIDNSPFQQKNFGQAVASYGCCTLLKTQLGTPCGVPGYLRRDSSRQSENDLLYEQSTSAIAAMPQAAYTNLLKDMLFLDSIGQRIDPSKSNNLLYSPDEEKFNLVDINPRSRPDYHNSPDEFIMMFFDNSYTWQYGGSASEKLIAARKIILDKTIQAAEELGIPLVQKEINSGLSYSLDLAGYAEKSNERNAIEQRIMALSQPAPRTNTQTRSVVHKHVPSHPHSLT